MSNVKNLTLFFIKKEWWAFKNSENSQPSFKSLKTWAHQTLQKDENCVWAVAERLSRNSVIAQLLEQFLTEAVCARRSCSVMHFSWCCRLYLNQWPLKDYSDYPEVTHRVTVITLCALELQSSCQTGCDWEVLETPGVLSEHFNKPIFAFLSSYQNMFGSLSLERSSVSKSWVWKIFIFLAAAF